MALRALHLCSGYGGFELALRLAGLDCLTVAHVERDAHAAATLVARMEEAHLDQAPIWDDLTTLDGAAWRGRVDLVTAGFPCQPFSAAGAGRGVDDERWLWPDIARIIADVGPRHVFLENVPQLVRHGLPHVLADLAELGFDAEWGCLPASAVGAPHERNRLWLWATLGDADSEGRPEDTRGTLGDATGRRQAEGEGSTPQGRSEGLADTEGTGLEGAGEREPQLAGTRSDGQGLGDADSDRCDERWSVRPQAAGQPDGCQCDPAAGDGEAAWPPGRDDADRWATYSGPQPLVRRAADGSTGRMVRPRGLGDRLHLLGNGLVPQAGAWALRQLISR
ncbi:MAG: DNA cytosine methyltransferase [Microthrixaceae bacterium]|nr:DNA cytosine methyltransferase [Microthrixaceae bacterium]